MDPIVKSVFHILCKMGAQSPFQAGKQNLCMGDGGWGGFLSYSLINYVNNNKPNRYNNEGDDGVSKETLMVDIQ